jgi:hypothetical protein
LGHSVQTQDDHLQVVAQSSGKLESGVAYAFSDLLSPAAAQAVDRG